MACLPYHTVTLTDKTWWYISCYDHIFNCTAKTKQTRKSAIAEKEMMVLEQLCSYAIPDVEISVVYTCLQYR